MARFAVLLVLLSGCGGSQEAASTTEDSQLAQTRPGDPVPGLSPAQRAAFEAGKAQFARAETPADGLGPVFNEASCVACHAGPAIGGGSPRTATRFGRVESGFFDPLAELGGSLLQDHAIPGYAPEVVPPQANVVAHRRTVPLFGLGLVDAIPDSVFRELSLREDPRVAGIFAGKFGWKGQNPTILEFCADAYLNEMGITSPLFPSENCPQGNCALLADNPRPDLNDDGGDVSKFADFVKYLAPIQPARAAPQGERVFQAIGCAGCHTATVAGLHPYSDFLLHDMGELGDGITQGIATGRLMRTQPLWGLRFEQTLLHDGRAKTVADAVKAHAGQGAAARDRFTACGRKTATICSHFSRACSLRAANFPCSLSGKRRASSRSSLSLVALSPSASS